MPAEITEKQSARSGEVRRADAHATGEAASVEPGTSSSQTPPSVHRPTRKRCLLIGVLGAVVLAGVFMWGTPWISQMLNTVSTDDAYGWAVDLRRHDVAEAVPR